MGFQLARDGRRTEAAVQESDVVGFALQDADDGTVPVRNWLRWWFYRRRWKAAMTLAGLAPDYRGQPMLPVLDRVHRSGAVDLVRVGLVTGQAPADFKARAENLAHAFGARLCRIRGAAPGAVMLDRSSP